MLQTQLHQRRFQLLGIADGNGIDQYQRRGAARGLHKSHRRIQGMQILECMIGANPVQMARYIRQRRVELGTCDACTLLCAAAAEGMQGCSPCRVRQVRMHYRGDGRCRRHGSQRAQSSECKKT